LAGYQNLSETWGILLALKQLSGFNPFIEEKFLEMGTIEFLVNIQIKNNIDDCDKKYQEILNKKK